MTDENSNEFGDDIKIKLSHFFDILVRRSQIKKGKIKPLHEFIEWTLTTVIFFAIAFLVAASRVSEKAGLDKNFSDFMADYGILAAVVIISIKLYYNNTRNLESSLHEREISLFKKLNTTIITQVKDINNKVEKVADDIDGYLSRSKIVFETGIKEYDDDHLLALKKILLSLENKNASKIYAIDNSDPIQWWSETMTGYMAMLADWKSKNPKREVYRIFIFTANELLSPIVTKTLTLHSLMGFKTYVFTKEKFEVIFNKFMSSLNGAARIKKKEVLIWENATNNLADCYVDLTHNRWHNISCYQSFWDMDISKDLRASYMQDPNHLWNNYHDTTQIKSEDIKIWFEFIPISSLNKLKNNWPDLPNQYLNLIETLINNTWCCDDQNELSDKTGNFGIEIKTKDNSGTGFEFTTNKAVKEILAAYKKKNTI